MIVLFQKVLEHDGMTKKESSDYRLVLAEIMRIKGKFM